MDRFDGAKEQRERETCSQRKNNKSAPVCVSIIPGNYTSVVRFKRPEMNPYVRLESQVPSSRTSRPAIGTVRPTVVQSTSRGHLGTSAASEDTVTGRLCTPTE